jgi:uncharacterized surface protein with fasciclin (FAS1) repeats
MIMQTTHGNRMVWSITAAGALLLSPLTAQDSEWDIPEDASPDEAPGLESVEVLVDDIRARGEFNEISYILEAVDLGNLVEEGEAYTFLLPDDEAFAGLNDTDGLTLTESAGAQELEAFLKGHIVEGAHTAEALRNGPVRTLAGHEIEGSRDFLLRTVVSPVDGNGDAIGEDARLVNADMEIAGVMVHAVNKVWYDGDTDDASAERRSDDEAVDEHDGPEPGTDYPEADADEDPVR